ncbi:hypothetical protein EDC19_2413 [Natranaerovirga hydrolytica]|uniref:Flp pilus assembly protein TadB n=1 Tax=Natranaerovirga hydrolytica TaxID=680378 RepID=A0A4R1MHN3_9FIRM|nr:hypothetical protein [Natranaerovirga hydrolytica]TCK90644.1 hypothetical protein EDC19_2413 [Natranaerovirga hydrolytica]
MVVIAKILAFIAVLYLIKELLYPVYKPVSKKQKKKARRYQKTKESNKLKSKMKNYKKRIAEKYIKNLLSSGEKVRYKKIIDRLDLPIKPEEIRAEQIFYSFVALLLTLLMLSANPLLGSITGIFIVLGWLYPVTELEKIIEEKNKNISIDFPSFYSMVYYQYSKSINIFLPDVIKDYIPNAAPDMAEELGVMLDNMDYGEEYALKQLKKRIPIHFIIKFCDIMETRLKGYDNVSQMSYLKNEMDQYRIRALEEELEKRERKNTRLQLVLIVVLIIYIIFYYLFTILEALKLFQ